WSSLIWSFFFFQAEDGIRDFHVTGVQTCALPIWEVAGKLRAGLGRLIPGRAKEVLAEASEWQRRLTSPDLPFEELERAGVLNGRSEERRVGKEGRSAWASPHQNSDTAV